MQISAADVKKLRDLTGSGMMDAKKALTEADGDSEKAITLLRKAGIASAAKRADREAKSGLVESYIHSGRIGVLVEVNCETDFVARTEDFKIFAKDVAMHVAASSPEYLSPEVVPAEVVAREKDVYAGEVATQNKPAEVLEKIISGKLDKYYSQVCLTKQAFVKDPDQSIEQLTAALIAKVGENVVIRRFVRLELGGAN